jgi:hypothetical protein
MLILLIFFIVVIKIWFHFDQLNENILEKSGMIITTEIYKKDYSPGKNAHYRNYFKISGFSIANEELYTKADYCPFQSN